MDLSDPPGLNAREAFAPLAPPIARASMTPRPWTGFFSGLASALRPRRARAEPASPAAWEIAAARRRRVLLLLVAASAAGAAALMFHGQPRGAGSAARVGQVLLFTLLFAWVAAGFCTALMGFVVRLRGDAQAPDPRAVAGRPIDPAARTAVVMPICNEHVGTVFAGLRATCESLAATGAASAFDFFVLSDTSDADTRAAELAELALLRATLGPDVPLYYRWRRRRARRKAGNVADFCRRWGKDYRYMIVLDADSVMTGECMTTLVRLMEAHPAVGIFQTVPQACGSQTLHARAQQFSASVTGALFTAGMAYWQLGESHYWGHNAILRVAPFMQGCALAKLSGRGGLSGEILSHDFVEAALMRRAGYQVWLAQHLPGSYEQAPPNLAEELRRDRRWCQGNLQNARLIAEPGLHSVHRAMLAAGAMAYLAAPLWMAYVLLGIVAWMAIGDTPVVAIAGAPWEMRVLWSLILALLFLPRLLALVAMVARGEQGDYGGTRALLSGVALEGVLAILQAPIRMVSHTLFVTGALTGLHLEWKSPPREARSIGWRDAARTFAPMSVAALLVLCAVSAIDFSATAWLVPAGLPLLLAVPLAVFTSDPLRGARLRARGLLVIPEERAAGSGDPRYQRQVPSPNSLATSGTTASNPRSW